jgi:uncharacterized protein affecting Mg2+/Co2+ transport
MKPEGGLKYRLQYWQITDETSDEWVMGAGVVNLQFCIAREAGVL